MALESGTRIPDLNAANPAGADPISQGDDHIRLIKNCVTGSFPAFVGTSATPKEVTLTEDQINDASLKAEAETISGDKTFTGAVTVDDLDADAKKVGFRNPTAIAAGNSRNLVQADEGRILMCTNASAIYTAETLEAFTVIRLIAQVGGVTLIPDPGVSINYIDGGGALLPAALGISIELNSIVEIVYSSAVAVQVFGNGIEVI